MDVKIRSEVEVYLHPNYMHPTYLHKVLREVKLKVNIIITGGRSICQREGFKVHLGKGSTLIMSTGTHDRILINISTEGKISRNTARYS